MCQPHRVQSRHYKRDSRRKEDAVPPAQIHQRMMTSASAQGEQIKNQIAEYHTQAADCKDLVLLWHQQHPSHHNALLCHRYDEASMVCDATVQGAIQPRALTQEVTQEEDTAEPEPTHHTIGRQLLAVG